MEGMRVKTGIVADLITSKFVITPIIITPAISSTQLHVFLQVQHIENVQMLQVQSDP